jgi:hypothetical protein
MAKFGQVISNTFFSDKLKVVVEYKIKQNQQKGAETENVRTIIWPARTHSCKECVTKTMKTINNNKK